MDITTRLYPMLDRILETAERRFGPRCEGWEFQGIRFHNAPPEMVYVGPTAVEIRLSVRCESDLIEAVYQLAHEAIHMLSPSGATTTLMEEGVAADFATGYLLDTRSVLYSPTGKYRYAMILWHKLKRLDWGIIARMRKEQPVISRIDAAMIRKYSPLDEETAQRLTMSFGE
jgi:hypothetical protein